VLSFIDLKLRVTNRNLQGVPGGNGSDFNPSSLDRVISLMGGVLKVFSREPQLVVVRVSSREDGNIQDVVVAFDLASLLVIRFSLTKGVPDGNIRLLMTPARI
jgi:hypothetical protein